jgi:hypothetical protein
VEGWTLHLAEGTWEEEGIGGEENTDKGVAKVQAQHIRENPKWH